MKVTAVLLAAGQGTRMKSEMPKVLHPLCGKPMVWHVLEALKSATTERPVVIVGIQCATHWGVVQGQHTSLWSCGSWFESRRPSQIVPANAGLL